MRDLDTDLALCLAFTSFAAFIVLIDIIGRIAA